MGRVELGTKCVCTTCSERFYDLQRVPAVCPKCKAVQPPPAPRVMRPMRRPSEAMRFEKRVAPVAEEPDALPEAEIDDEAETLDPDDADDEAVEDVIDEEIDVEKPVRLE